MNLCGRICQDVSLKSLISLNVSAFFFWPPKSPTQQNSNSCYNHVSVKFLWVGFANSMDPFKTTACRHIHVQKHSHSLGQSWTLLESWIVRHQLKPANKWSQRTEDAQPCHASPSHVFISHLLPSGLDMHDQKSMCNHSQSHPHTRGCKLASCHWILKSWKERKNGSY